MIKFFSLSQTQMQDFVKNRMRRDNVSNLFQTPKLREIEPTTASSYQPITDAPPCDKTFFRERNYFTDYTEDLIKYKHTMRWGGVERA